MSEPTPGPVRHKGFNRSPGLKLLLICGLVLLMSIPALFVYLIVYDRSGRAERTRNEIARAAGGEQSVIGPVLAIPVRTLMDDKRWSPADVLLVFADTGEAAADLDVSTRRKSLYSAQVYEGDVAFQAHFNLSVLGPADDGQTRLDLAHASILLAIRDRRGVLDDVQLQSPGHEPVAFQLYTGINTAAQNYDEAARNIATGSLSFFQLSGGNSTILGAPAGKLLDGEALDVTIRLPLGGAKSITLVPFARSTRIALVANWPNPGFSGDFLPTQKTITAKGFKASRVIPALASAIPRKAFDSHFSNVRGHRAGLAVKLVAKTSPYQYVSRSLKYALMFTGFVFLTYFLFEIIDAKPVHAAQYVLIGIAQTIFFLLLLAFSERIGFDAAFAVAALATVGLLGAYAGAVFGRRRALAAFVIFGTLYGLMFVLMRLEDYALMVGALASFAVIAITMWMTRKINWYGNGQFRARQTG